MIDSPRGVQEVEECRGLILDRNDWSVVAMPFYRFYNQNEGFAPEMVWDNCTLLEKVDGSMIILYWHPYKNEWTVATRGNILAAGSVGKNAEKKFSDLFWETVNEYCPDVDFGCLDKRINLVFELMGPENRILTLYENKELRLLAGRNLDTLEELNQSELDALGKNLDIERPKTYDFNNLDDIFKIFDEFNPTDEGFVVTDYTRKVNGHFPRCKIKNPRYLALHHLLGAGDDDLFTNKRTIQLILSGDAEEIISYFPEYADQIHKMETNIERLANMMDEDYKRLNAMALDKKTFAMKAQQTPYPHILFAINNGKVENSRAFIMGMKEETLIDMLTLLES
jgi:RNA ligase